MMTEMAARISHRVRRMKYISSIEQIAAPTRKWRAQRAVAILSSDVFSRHHRKVRVLFAVSDILLTAIAFEAAYQTRLALDLHFVFYLTVPIKALMLGFAVLVWVAIGFWFDIYERLDSAHPRIVLRDTFRQCALGAVAVVLFQYSLRLDLSRFFLALFGLYAWLLLVLFRLKAGRVIGFVRREFGALHYVMVVGAGERARAMGEALEASASYGIRLVGFLADSPSAPAGEMKLKNTYPLHPLSELHNLLCEHVIDEVIIAVDSRRLPDLEELFLQCDEQGVRTRVAVDFFPHVNSELYLDRLGAAPLLTFSAAPHDEIRLMLKRATDVVLALAGLLLLSPVMIFIALLIRITSPGPAIFRQVRCGLNGRKFVFYKFRSMCVNAEQLKPHVSHLNQKELAFKIPNDPRLTAVGRWLRKFSMDELPQLWNVVKGDMSLVGPRPAVPEEVEQYKRWQRRRLRMRPGLTCLWALAGRDRLDFETWMRLDMQYIENWSLALDWKIILQTIPRVLTGRGAH
jgi:exopolysaccharide biosynthesis polyprenyl glycosylphosphotransferase